MRKTTSPSGQPVFRPGFEMSVATVQIRMASAELTCSVRDQILDFPNPSLFVNAMKRPVFSGPRPVRDARFLALFP